VIAAQTLFEPLFHHIWPSTLTYLNSFLRWEVSNISKPEIHAIDVFDGALELS